MNTSSSSSVSSYRRPRSPPTASSGDGDGKFGSNLLESIITVGNWTMVAEGGIEYARRHSITGVKILVPGLEFQIASVESDIESRDNRGIWVETMSSKFFWSEILSDLEAFDGLFRLNTRTHNYARSVLSCPDLRVGAGTPGYGEIGFRNTHT